MPGTFSQSYAPQFAGGIFQVASQFVGQALVDSIRKQFPRRKTQRGDFYAELTQDLLDTHLPLIKPEDRFTIKMMLAQSVSGLLAGSLVVLTSQSSCNVTG
jgi:hypothetical protein